MNIIGIILNWDWFKISQGIIGVCMALIANNALSTWKKQLKAKIVTDFLNEITETVHEYILSMSTSQKLVEFVNIGINAYSLSLPNEESNYQNTGFIKYIESNGKDMSSRLLKHLDISRPVVAKLSSLLTKGQVFGLKNYEKCHDSCNKLLWQFNCIEALAVTIGSQTLNWQNELVQKNLTDLSKIKAEDLKEQMQKSNVEFLEYIKECYRTTYQ